jgi:hypothetical protein
MNSTAINRREVKQMLAHVILTIGCALWTIGVIGQLVR